MWRRGTQMGCQAGHSRAPESSWPRALSQPRRSLAQLPRSPEAMKEHPRAPFLTVPSLCLGAVWLPGPHSGWRPCPDTGLNLRHGSAQPYTLQACAKATQTRVPQGLRVVAHPCLGPPVPGVRPSGRPAFPGVESAFALQPHRLMGTVCHCGSGGRVLCVSASLRVCVSSAPLPCV